MQAFVINYLFLVLMVKILDYNKMIARIMALFNFTLKLV